MLSLLGGWVRWLAGIDEPKDNQAASVDSDSDMDSEMDSTDGDSTDGDNSRVSQDDSAGTSTPREDYVPTYADVFVVKSMLLVPHGYSLPPEIVDMIVDHAGYWAHTTSEVRFGDDIHTMKAITQHIEDELLVSQPPPSPPTPSNPPLPAPHPTPRLPPLATPVHHQPPTRRHPHPPPNPQSPRRTLPP